ncbi:MAG TPA: DUF885 family protein, partial [Candidatus Polarisedimenticolia bacterium]|nr:DUF885 family protein [Candidatus Polarisedimenticolia bacterium]
MRPFRVRTLSRLAAAAASCLAVVLLPAPFMTDAPRAAGAPRGPISRPGPRPPQSRIPGGIPEGAQGPDLAFYSLADRYVEESFRAYPTLATVVGYHRYDSLLENLTPAGLRAKLDLAKRYRAELTSVDPKRLSVSARIDYELMLNDVDGTIFTLSELKSYDWDPQNYIDILGNTTLYLTLQEPDSPVWPERLAALLARMKQIPTFLAAARENLRNPPRVITDMVIQTNAGNIAFFEQSAPPLFAKAPALKGQLEREN